MRRLIRNWNDVLALLVILGLPLYWWLAAPNQAVEGGTLVGWSLVIQFYFRRAAPEEPAETVPHG